MNMRSVLAFLCLMSPAHAWEVTVGTICTLTHETPGASVILTHDPIVPEFSLALTLTEGTWPRAPRFTMTFSNGIVIGTDRHVLSEDGRTLTVTDRGFGNVINGLGGDGQVLATSGDRQVTLPLAGAELPTWTFSQCISVAQARPSLGEPITT